MRVIWAETAIRLRCIGVFAGVVLMAMMVAPLAGAQTLEPKTAEEKATEWRAKEANTQTFHLVNAYQMRDLNDIQTDLRNLFPMAKIYGVETQHAISAQGTAEELGYMQKVIQELDKPRKIYRLTYTITEMDGGKSLSMNHFSLVVADGGKATLKQGSRVPIVTGSTDAGTPVHQTQVQYQDVGLTIEASLDGGSLHSKVVRTNLAEEKSGVGLEDPILRESLFEGTSFILSEKAQILGALDIPGSTRHEEIAVVSELVR